MERHDTPTAGGVNIGGPLCGERLDLRVGGVALPLACQRFVRHPGDHKTRIIGHDDHGETVDGVLVWSAVTLVGAMAAPPPPRRTG